MDRVVCMNKKINELKSQLQAVIENGNAKDVTKIRGRLINAYKKRLNELLNDNDISEDEKQELETYRAELQEQVYKHKIQLSSRYRSEFIDEKATPSTIFTVLPKSVGIAAKKVKACIDDVKSAKNNKEKRGKIWEVAKSVGLLAATPVIYLGKFALQQWYLFAAAIGGKYLYDNNSLFRKGVDTVTGTIEQGFNSAKDSINSGLTNLGDNIKTEAGHLVDNVKDAINNGNLGDIVQDFGAGLNK
jgi:predicted RNA-binding protein